MLSEEPLCQEHPVNWAQPAPHGGTACMTRVCQESRAARSAALHTVVPGGTIGVTFDGPETQGTRNLQDGSRVECLAAGSSLPLSPRREVAGLRAPSAQMQ